jgi:hypothetical protein
MDETQPVNRAQQNPNPTKAQMVAVHTGSMRAYNRSQAQGLRLWQVSSGRHYAAASGEDAEALDRQRGRSVRAAELTPE